MFKSSALERLPADIQILIFKCAPDVATLFSLISTSAHFLLLYLRERDQILTSAVCNQLGNNLSQGVYLVRSSIASTGSYFEKLKQVSFNEAKLLYKQDNLIDALIQQCVDFQLKTRVQLSDIELFRMRRGLYNFGLTAKLTKEEELNDFEILCERFPPTEILESLYVLHCLRDLTKDYIMRIEEFTFQNLSNGTIGNVPWQDDEWLFFGADYGDYIQEEWIANAPWLLKLQQLYDLRLPIDLDRYNAFEPNAANAPEQFSYDDLLKECISADYLFDESSCAGINRNTEEFLAKEFRDLYIKAIPLGYMIWDENRLAQMSWKDRLPNALTPEELEEKWRIRRISVQQRMYDSY